MKIKNILILWLFLPSLLSANLPEIKRLDQKLYFNRTVPSEWKEVWDSLLQQTLAGNGFFDNIVSDFIKKLPSDMNDEDKKNFYAYLRDMTNTLVIFSNGLHRLYPDFFTNEKILKNIKKLDHVGGSQKTWMELTYVQLQRQHNIFNFAIKNYLSKEEGGSLQKAMIKNQLFLRWCFERIYHENLSKGSPGHITHLRAKIRKSIAITYAYYLGLIELFDKFIKMAPEKSEEHKSLEEMRHLSISIYRALFQFTDTSNVTTDIQQNLERELAQEEEEKRQFEVSKNQQAADLSTSIKKNPLMDYLNGKWGGIDWIKKLNQSSVLDDLEFHQRIQKRIDSDAIESPESEAIAYHRYPIWVEIFTQMLIRENVLTSDGQHKHYKINMVKLAAESQQWYEGQIHFKKGTKNQNMIIHRGLENIQMTEEVSAEITADFNLLKDILANQRDEFSEHCKKQTQQVIFTLQAKPFFHNLPPELKQNQGTFIIKADASMLIWGREIDENFYFYYISAYL